MPPPPDRSLVHWSLGFFKAKGYRISVFCPNVHGAQIDLAQVIDRLGPDWEDLHDRRFMDLFRCKVCGQRGHSVTIEPPNGY